MDVEVFGHAIEENACPATPILHQAQQQCLFDGVAREESESWLHSFGGQHETQVRSHKLVGIHDRGLYVISYY